MRIGFIGLGLMGRPMAENLYKAGNEMHVYDVNMDAVKKLEECGCIREDSVRELSEKVEMIVMSLPNDRIVNEVMDEVLACEKLSVKNICDMSSVSPSTSLKLAERSAERGIDFFDCPVSGGSIGAQNGTLTVMVGSKEEDAEKIMPVLNVLGKNYYFMGKKGSGSASKVLNQYLGAACLVSNCEMLAVAKKFDIDLEKLMDVIQHSSGNSKQVEFFVAPFVKNRNFDPKFTLDLFAKDVSLMISLAQDLEVPLPVGNEVFNVMQMAKSLGCGKEDAISVIKLFEQFIGEKVN